MSRYVDIDKLKWNVVMFGDMPVPICFTDEAEDEDIAPIVHAHWVKAHKTMMCSNCETYPWTEEEFNDMDKDFSRYCPCCGAKMDEEVTR